MFYRILVCLTGQFMFDKCVWQDKCVLDWTVYV